MNQSVLQVNDLCLRDILHNVSFELADQEMLAIMGPSGSGKSTLLYAIAGMEKADQGKAADKVAFSKSPNSVD